MLIEFVFLFLRVTSVVDLISEMRRQHDWLCSVYVVKLDILLIECD